MWGTSAALRERRPRRGYRRFWARLVRPASLRRAAHGRRVHSDPHRYQARHGQQQTQRVDPPTRCRVLRDLRGPDESGSPPRPQAGRPHQARTTRKTGMDTPDGHATAEDSRDLPPLPRGHPRRTGHRHTTETTTGERDAGKLARPVREGADGKGPKPRAPRQRPTSPGGRRKRTCTRTSPTAHRYQGRPGPPHPGRHRRADRQGREGRRRQGAREAEPVHHHHWRHQEGQPAAGTEGPRPGRDQGLSPTSTTRTPIS